MAIVKIQHRRGNYADYDPSKVLPGELVVTQADDPNSTDGEAVYIATTAGNVKQLATMQDMQSVVDTAIEGAISEVTERVEEYIEEIETTGNEVLDSIPADYTQLSEDVDTLKDDLAQIVPGLSDEAKDALLACFQNVAWAESDGQSYYDDLYEALYNETPVVIPDISLGTWQRGGTWNEDGSEGTSNYWIINRTYYAVQPDTEYTWIQGIASYNQSSNNMIGVVNRYRVCVYDVDKNFIGYISNEANNTDDITYIESRYFTFTTPQNAAFIRLSCNRWPVGFFARRMPNDVYCVFYVVRNSNDSNITVTSDVENVLTVSRNGIDITAYAKTGAMNTVMDTETYQFARGEFAINSGGNAEGGPATRTNTRLLLIKNLLLQEGDVITINGLNVAVWAQKLTGGTIQHTSSWLTTGDTFTIGG